MTNNKYLTYVRYNLSLLFVFFLLAACAQVKNTHNLELPIISSQFANYYEKSPSGVYEFYLKPEYKKWMTPFNVQESDRKIKGHHFSYDHVNTNITYIELGRFELDGYLYKLVAYNRSDDADVVIFNIQLNSYDNNGKLVDALLLDSRFGFEEIQKYSEFEITQEHVTINYYVTQIIEIVDGGELGEEIIAPQAKLDMTEEYRIDQGHFKLIFMNEFK